jgi:hypothetical protein
VTVNRAPREVKDFVGSSTADDQGRSVDPMKRTAVALVAVLALLGGGCSDGDGADGGSGDGATATTTTEPATTTTAPAPEPLEDQTAPESINGITVQGDTLWVASIAGDQILQVDRESGAILQRFDTAGAGPDDVAVGPDGSVWSTGFVNGDVGRITDGEYEVATTIKPGINPLEFNADGLLYIATMGADGELFQLDPSDPKAFTRSLGGGLPSINAFGITTDGTIVAPAGGLATPGSAVAITIVAVEEDPTGDKTVEPIVEDLPGVAGGATDADGNPYVLANVTGEVIAIDVEAKTSEVVQTVTQGAPFDNLAFAEDGMLYLSSFTAPTITEVSPDGTERVITIGG